MAQTWRRKTRRERNLLALIVEVVDVLIEHQPADSPQREDLLRPNLCSTEEMLADGTTSSTEATVAYFVRIACLPVVVLMYRRRGKDEVST